ncbi:MAG: bifunctional transaldolase/phosoglucose isomerase, partial [Terracidiphilus sp.]
SLFTDAADSLSTALALKRQRILASKLDGQRFARGERLEGPLRRTEEEWRVQGTIRRIWRQDKAVWKGVDGDKLLGWLESAQRNLRQVSRYEDFAAQVRGEGFTDVVLLGIGGSSLGPAVLNEILATSDGLPLHVLDSAEPGQIRKIEQAVALKSTLVVVSSKSGSTLETNLLFDYFWERLEKTVGRDGVGRHFVAITDPGSPLETRAQRGAFRELFLGDPAIGGRYSVLSPFGLVPAALRGIKVSRLLESAEHMVHACAADVPPAANAAVQLGLAMGLAGLNGMNYVTISSSKDLRSFTEWAEQLIAESTGKDGKGLIPIIDEALGSPRDYGPDRFFIDVSSGRCLTDQERAGKLNA